MGIDGKIFSLIWNRKLDLILSIWLEWVNFDQEIGEEWEHEWGANSVMEYINFSRWKLRNFIFCYYWAIYFQPSITGDLFLNFIYSFVSVFTL